jgi:hypothetical protein
MDTENPELRDKFAMPEAREEIDALSMTETEGSDIEEREIIFKSLTKRTPATVKHVSSSIYSTDNEIYDIQPTDMPAIRSTGGFFEALLQIPFRYLFQSEKDERREPVPVIFSAIKVAVSRATIEDRHFYLLDLSYGELFNWNIYRRIRDLVKLHSVLTFEHLKGHLPKLPTFPKQIIKKGPENHHLIQI